MAYNHKYKLLRIQAIQRLAYQHYEPGRQDRSWRWVWRCHILPIYQIGFRTFEQYMSIDVESKLNEMDKNSVQIPF